MGVIYFWRQGEVYEYTGSGDAQAVWESGFTNYSPDNCVWATRKQQANNRRPKGASK